MDCDTITVTGERNREGLTIFAKNSDREPNEAQQVVFAPAADHDLSDSRGSRDGSGGGKLKCTYIEIPQVEHTYAVLLSKPFWMWGAEMGINEKGLAIGNEAVFTRAPYGKKPGLIGMDMLRLALERAATAREAVEVITGLLGRYGQSGNCGYLHPLYYHNSFILADPNESWVLETSGKSWVAKRVRGIYTISNCLTIGNDWDMASDDIAKGGLLRKGFNFAKNYSDFFYTKFSYGRERRNYSQKVLEHIDNNGGISLKDITGILRSHDEWVNQWEPKSDEGSRANNFDGYKYLGSNSLNKNITGKFSGASLCMHAGWGPIRISQTVGSMICLLSPDSPEKSLVLVTGTAAPCTSTFKPMWIDSLAGTDSDGGIEKLLDSLKPGASFDASKIFWKHELLHRSTLRNPEELLKLYASERDKLEEEIITGALSLSAISVPKPTSEASPEERLAFMVEAFGKVATMEEAAFKQVEQAEVKDVRGRPYRSAWRRFNRLAGINVKD